MPKRVLRWMGVLVLGTLLIGCSAVDAGSRQARVTAVKVGNRIEEGTDDLARKGRTFWQWLTGRDDEPKRKTVRTSESQTPSTTTLDAKPQPYVGREN